MKRSGQRHFRNGHFLMSASSKIPSISHLYAKKQPIAKMLGLQFCLVYSGMAEPHITNRDPQALFEKRSLPTCFLQSKCWAWAFAHIEMVRNQAQPLMTLMPAS